ncbi:MAG: tRNA adenosine(34) deaminase TadA [Atribacterota bacterium]|nr:tRNA adenosine(34) deaminase TadA [Atribacterota bacterium]MDD4896476.1 tRNA adenosine(34) deaminase TadA [Atribacterota bacterium]MDD5637279.1 tRNA adenosine(34) deaminase TadA [Atribacterota bacterium]
MIDNIHQMIMQEAIQLAWEAFYREEVPVGALIVLDEQIIARAFNEKEMTHDPTAHAEIIALREACARVNSWHLDDAIMYVTLEPCPMCAYAIIQARLKKLIFGAYDPKAGAAGSVINIFEKKLFNHEIEVIGGILEDECGAVLKKFFLNRR